MFTLLELMFTLAAMGALMLMLGFCALNTACALQDLRELSNDPHKESETMKRILVSIGFVLCMLVPVVAQEETLLPITPEATEVSTETPIVVEDGGTIIINEPEPQVDVSTTDIGQAFESLLKLVTDITFLPFAVAFVVAATAIAKHFIPAGLISPQALALMFQAGIWIVYVVLKERFGVSDQAFRSVLDALTTILSGVAMFVVGSGVTQRAYDTLHRNDVPLVGQAQPASLRSSKS